MTKKWKKKFIDLQLLQLQEQTLCTDRIVAQEWRWLLLGKATSVWEKTSGPLSDSVRSKIYLEDFPCGLAKMQFLHRIVLQQFNIIVSEILRILQSGYYRYSFRDFAISITPTIFKTLPKSHLRTRPHLIYEITTQRPSHLLSIQGFGFYFR